MREERIISSRTLRLIFAPLAVKFFSSTAKDAKRRREERKGLISL